MSPLIVAAKFSRRRLAVENYTIAAVCGICLGVMLALGV